MRGRVHSATVLKLSLHRTGSTRQPRHSSASRGCPQQIMAVTRGKTRKAKQGGVVTQAMTLIALASSAFILLPAGRDIVANTLAILPGEAETRPLIDMAHPAARDGIRGVRL